MGFDPCSTSRISGPGTSLDAGKTHGSDTRSHLETITTLKKQITTFSLPRGPCAVLGAKSRALSREKRPSFSDPLEVSTPPETERVFELASPRFQSNPTSSALSWHCLCSQP